VASVLVNNGTSRAPTQIPPVLTNICVQNDEELVSMC